MKMGHLILEILDLKLRYLVINKKVMLYRSLVFLSIVCFSVSEKFENIETKDFLTILKINNSELRIIVDSLVKHERAMDYYDSNLIFFIDIQHTSSVTLLSIGSSHKIMKSGNEIGCFKIKNHTFVVSSNYETDLFKKTKWKKKFVFYKPVEEVNDTLEIISIEIFEDDSYTQWNYWLRDGKIVRI